MRSRGKLPRAFVEYDVTQVAEQNQLSHFTRLEMNVNGKPLPAWMEKLRSNALARFERVGFPSNKTEAWRFTNVAPIAKTPWELAEPGGAAEAGPLVEQFTFGRDAVAELVFVNGHFHGELSRLGKLPRGVRVGSLAEAVANDGEAVQRHLIEE